MRQLVAILVVGLALTSGTPAVWAQSSTGTPTQDGQQACDRLTQNPSLTQEGRQAIQELLTSSKGPTVMDRLMRLAKGTGKGDTVTGLERLTDAMEKMEKLGTLGSLLGGTKP